MRTRLCYLALVLVPLVAYGPLLWQSYGTPEDFLRLAGETDGVQHGILHSALVDISFHFVNDVAAFAWLRALALLLVVLCGVALWQLFERGGWSAWDAAAAALGVVLLPSAQLFVGWGPTWPAVLAGLLSVAGFAAAESELEPAGPRRFVGMLGGAMLYFAAAMCFLPNAVLALVPLAALTFARPLRFADQLGKWFASHVGLMLLGIGAAWAIDRWMMSDVGLADRTSLAERLVSLFTFSVPSSWATFLVGEQSAMRVVCAVIALAVLTMIVLSARQQTKDDPRVQTAWLLAVLGPSVLFALIVVLSPHWQPGYRTIWPLAGVVVVALAAAVRGVGDRPGKKPFWHFAAFGGLGVVAALAAGAQAHRYFAEPLRDEWSTMRAAVMRANFTGDTRVVLVTGSETRASVDALFVTSAHRDGEAAKAMFRAALRDRFPSGLPRNQRVDVEAAAQAPVEPGANTLIFDLRQPVR